VIRTISVEMTERAGNLSATQIVGESCARADD
jgi:hypothetical protein